MPDLDLDSTLIQTSEDKVIQRLVAWGTERQDIRAMLWTSSRTNPNAPVDLFSDYDIIMAVRDVNQYYNDENWLEDFGRVLVVYRDPLSPERGYERFAYITQYEEGLKIDFSVWPVELLCNVATDPHLPDYLDVGYRILVDKDGLTGRLNPPTYRAFIPSPPEETLYHGTIEEFFHEATYVAKHLWRDDLIAAKYNLEFMMKFKLLRRMLEWQMEIDHNWSVKLGAYGRGLKIMMRPEIWAEFENTFAGSGIADNWTALFRTIGLFRKAAVEVGQRLGYEYLHELDRRAVQYLRNIESLDRQVSDFPAIFKHGRPNE